MASHHKFSISRNFNRIHAKIVKQYVYTKSMGCQNVKMTWKIIMIILVLCKWCVYYVDDILIWNM
jgi:hypothetical protein